MIRPALALTLIGLIAAPAVARDRAADRERPLAWRTEVLQRDHYRVHNWRQAWLEGIAAAKAGGSGAQLAAEGALLDPDAGQNDPTLPDGAYRCRTIKLGGGGKGFREEAPVPCRVAAGRFTELAGAQRIDGFFWHYDGVRRLLLGSLAVGDEHDAMPYGRDEQRDVVGFLERIGPRRWRIALPRPAWEARETVIELTPGG